MDKPTCELFRNKSPNCLQVDCLQSAGSLSTFGSALCKCYMLHMYLVSQVDPELHYYPDCAFKEIIVFFNHIQINIFFFWYSLQPDSDYTAYKIQGIKSPAICFPNAFLNQLLNRFMLPVDTKW